MEFKKLKYLGAAAVPLAALIYLFSSVMKQGNILFGHDFLSIYLPFKMFAKKAVFLFHQLPLWLPDLFFGAPGIASSSIIFYYPTDILFMLLSVPLQNTFAIDVIIHLIAAFAGTYLFLKACGLTRGASFFGGICVMFAGYNVSYAFAGHINNIKAGALIPFVMYFLRRGLVQKRVSMYLFAGLIMGLQITATGMQVMAYTAALAVLYVMYHLIFEEKSQKARIFAAIAAGAALIFSILVSLPQFIPSFEYKNYSWRGEFTFNDFISWSLHPKEILQLLMPSLFGLHGQNYYGFWSMNLTTYYFGILPFLLLPFAFMKGQTRKLSFFLGGASLLFLLLSMGGYTPLYKLLWHFPVFNQFRNPSRFMYIFTVIFCALSAVGLNNVIKVIAEKKVQQSKNFFYAAFGVCGSLALLYTGIAFNAAGFISGIFRQTRSAEMPADALNKAVLLTQADAAAGILILFLFCVLMFLVLKNRVKSAFIIAIIAAAISAADSSRIQKNFITPFNYDGYFPKNDMVSSAIKQNGNKGRIADFNFFWGANRGMYYGIESAKGFHGMLPLKFYAMQSSGMFNRISVNRGLNISYYISRDEIIGQGITKIGDDNTNKVFADALALPLGYFTDNVINAGSEKKVFEMMKEGVFVTGMALTESDTGIVYKDGAPALVDITEKTPNRIKAKVITDRQGLFVLNVSNYKKWRAFVNGKKADIVDVNYNMMAVKVQPGTSEIRFVYGNFRDYLIILLSIIFMAGVFVIWKIELKKLNNIKGEKQHG